jgi:tetratricopeptide (TPR) repeat protein
MQAKNFDSLLGKQFVVAHMKTKYETELSASANRPHRSVFWRPAAGLRGLLAALLLAGLIFVIPAFAQTGGSQQGGSDATGGTHNIFQLGFGARAIGLGSAVVSMPLDASTVYWNPGALDFLEQQNVVLFYSSLLEGTKYHSLGLAYPLLGVGTFGAAWLHYDTGEIVTRDIDSNPTGTLTAGEDLFLFSYGRQLPFEGLAIGGSIKFQRQQIVGFTASGFGGDLGFLYRPDFGEGALQNLAFGLTIHNLVSPRLKPGRTAESIPSITRGGVAKSLRFGARADLIHLFLGFEKRAGLGLMPKFGSEYVYQDRAMLRLGFNGEQPSFGGGVIYQMFQIDYAFGKYAKDAAGDIGSQHRISLTIHFGKTKAELREIAKARELQRIEAETRKKEILNRRNDFEDKLTTGKAYFQQGDYFQALIRLAAANDLAAGAYEVFTEAEREEARVWVERTNQKIAEEEKQRQEKIKQEELARAESERTRTCVEEQMQRGLKYIQAGKYREAVVEWQRGLECDPSNEKLKSLIQQAEGEMRSRKNELLRLAQTHVSQGQIMEAIRVYNQLLTQNSITPAEQKEIEDRVSQLQKQLTVQESYRQGYSEYLNKNYCAAKGYFVQALQVDPNNAKIKQFVDDADSRCNARLKDFDNDTIRQRFLQAIGQIQRENYEAALGILEEIQKQDRYNKRILDAIDQARERMKKK